VSCSPQSVSGRWSPGTASVMDRWVMKWSGRRRASATHRGREDDVTGVWVLLAAAEARRRTPTTGDHWGPMARRTVLQRPGRRCMVNGGTARSRVADWAAMSGHRVAA
jgi:hypothetical protein